MRWLAYRYIRLRGWKITGDLPEISKFVIIGGPHTSNWDFVFFLALIQYLGIKPKVLGKHTLVKWPFGILMRRWGVIPVRRDVAENTVERVKETFDASDEMMLVIAPEGTRARADSWRSGFYKITHGAGVPLLMAAIDGEKKLVEISEPLTLTGTISTDMDHIRSFYEGMHGLKPENASLIRLRDES
jgi:1-acyl-sn-glycerol-3-phosphate acyltransferase